MTKNSIKRQAKIIRREASFFNAIVVQMKCCVTLRLQVLHNLSTFTLSKDQSEISHLSCEILRNIPKCIHISTVFKGLKSPGQIVLAFNTASVS